MKINVCRDMFVEEFDKYNRGNNFSKIGRIALYDYLVDLEEDQEVEYDFDVITICCTWKEGTEEIIKDEYDLTIEEMKEKTTIVKIDGTDRYIYMTF